MAHIAKKAGVSKETLYSWFGDKSGIAGALVQPNADKSISMPAMDTLTSSHSLADARRTLVACATRLLTLLTSRESIALNRIAIDSPDLAEVLLKHGRGRIGPSIERYFTMLHKREILALPDVCNGFRLFYELVIQDNQI